MAERGEFRRVWSLVGIIGHISFDIYQVSLKGTGFGLLRF
jgi:hypothetical protein